MKPKLVFIIVALVIIPTAVLSLLAGGSLRIREEAVRNHRRLSATDAARAAGDLLEAELATLHAVVARTLQSKLVGNQESLLAAVEKLHQPSGVVEQVYALSLTEGLV